MLTNTIQLCSKKVFVTQQPPLVVVIFRSKKKVSLQRYCTDYCGMRGTCLYLTHYIMISNFRRNASICCVWSALNWRISFTIKKGLRLTQKKSNKTASSIDAIAYCPIAIITWDCLIFYGFELKLSNLSLNSQLIILC